MPPKDDKSREGSPARPTTESKGFDGSSARVRQGPVNTIEFVDGRDPNVKSAIQRHTAYHSATQRREARLQSLRRGTQSRYLDWGRRPDPESATPLSLESSASSPQINPASIRQTSEAPNLSRQSSGESIPALTPSEEALLQFCRNYIHAQHQLVASKRDSITHVRGTSLANLGLGFAETDSPSKHTPDAQAFKAIISFIRLDEACIQLFLAYSHSLRARLCDSGADRERDHQAAQQYLARGTTSLRKSLRDSRTAVSDANIQAVLLLVSYTSDFGQRSEMEMHADALKTMVQQRGGLDALSRNAVLHRQLVTADTARKYHLTLGCRQDCCRELRFPGGFWTSR